MPKPESNQNARKKIIFITGTDTGVGKTLFTALLLSHLRGAGVHALAMKPFCSGGRGDVRLLQALQRGELSDAEMNPYYFKQPVAPLVAVAGRGRNLRLREVVARVQEVRDRCEVLLVEGAGGLFVPLGKGFLVSDLITALRARVVVVARNRLGVINHTLLTVATLRATGQEPTGVVLMGDSRKDLSTKSNAPTLAKLLFPLQITVFPYLGARASRVEAVKRQGAKVKNALATLVGRAEIG